MSIFGPLLGGAVFSQFGVLGSGAMGGVPFAALTGQPEIKPEQKAKPQDPIDRTSIWSVGAAASAYPGFDDAPLPSLPILWQMRQYPTCMLAFAVVVGPVLAGKRTIEIVNDLGQPDMVKKWQEAATKYYLPFVEKSFEPACECLNFGAWMQEVIWDRVEGVTVPIQPRSFLPGECTVYQDRYRQFAGFQIGAQYRDQRYALNVVNQRHIDPIFGYARALAARLAWWRSLQSARNADKLERKASGIQMMLSVPMGNTWKDPVTGKPYTADQLAQKYANYGAEGITFTVPRYAFTKEEIMNKPELADIDVVKAKEFDWGNSGPALEAHIARMDRLDRDIMRAWRRPERESMQGEHGTQAEAGEHGQVGVNDSEIVAAMVLTQTDEQVLDRFLVTNYGPKALGALRTKQAPLSDPQQQFLQRIAEVLLGDQTTAPDVAIHIDDRQLVEKLELPVRDQKEVDKDLADQEKEKQQQQTQQLQHQKAQLDIQRTAAQNRGGGGAGPGGQNGSGQNGNGKGPNGGGFGGRLKDLGLSTDEEGEGPRLHRWDRERIIEAARVTVTRELPELIRSATVALAAEDSGKKNFPTVTAAQKYLHEHHNGHGGITLPDGTKAEQCRCGGGEQVTADVDDREKIALAADDGEGHWVTIDGAHVFIKGGIIAKGPAHLVGKEDPGEAAIRAKHQSEIDKSKAQIEWAQAKRKEIAGNKDPKIKAKDRAEANAFLDQHEAAHRQNIEEHTAAIPEEIQAYRESAPERAEYEKHKAEIAKRTESQYRDIREALEQGHTLTVPTRTRVTHITPDRKDNLRLKNGTVEMREGKDWVAVVGEAMESLHSRAVKLMGRSVTSLSADGTPLAPLGQLPLELDSGAGQGHLFGGGGGGQQGHLFGGRWVTIDGEHVYIKDGRIEAGPKSLEGKKLSELSDEAHAASKKANASQDGHEHLEAAKAHKRAETAHRAAGGAHAETADLHKAAAAHHELQGNAHLASQAAEHESQRAREQNTAEANRRAGEAHAHAAREHVEAGNSDKVRHHEAMETQHARRMQELEPTEKANRLGQQARELSQKSVGSSDPEAYRAAANAHHQAEMAHRAAGNSDQADSHSRADQKLLAQAHAIELGNEARQLSKTAETEKTAKSHGRASAAHTNAARAHREAQTVGEHYEAHTKQAEYHARQMRELVGPAQEAEAEGARAAAEQASEKATEGRNPALHRAAADLHEEAAKKYSDLAAVAQYGTEKFNQFSAGVERHRNRAAMHRRAAGIMEGEPLAARAAELRGKAEAASKKAESDPTAKNHKAAAELHQQTADALDAAAKGGAYGEASDYLNQTARDSARYHAAASARHAAAADTAERGPKEKKAAEAAMKKIADVHAQHEAKIAELEAQRQPLMKETADLFERAKQFEPANYRDQLRAHVMAGNRLETFNRTPAHQSALDKANAAQEKASKLYEEILKTREARKSAMFDALTGHRPHNPNAYKIDVQHKAAGFDMMAPGIEAFQRLLGPDAKGSGKMSTTGRFKGRGYRGRSFSYKETAHMAGGASAATVVHELGHVLEHQDPEVFRRAKDFLDRRTAGQTAQSLKKLTGINYGRDEKAKAGNFIDPYVGKIYSGGASNHGLGSTEVVSMGLEHMYRDPHAFAQKDPEHFALIHGIMHMHDKAAQ